MQPIFVLVIIGAAAAMSLGYMTNELSVESQSFGVGEDTVENPISDAVLTILVGRTYGITSIDYKDIITECAFRSTTVALDANTRLICKLLDDNGDIIAEGSKIVLTDIATDTPVTIPIDNFAFENANNANNVHDIFIIVQGPPSS